MPAQKLADKHSLKILGMEPTPIPPNNSHQHLMNDCDAMDGVPGNGRVRVTEGVTKTQWITVIILCFVNLINYMDRYTIAGILTDIQKYYNVGDQLGGLLQTAFVLSYMLFAPIFGYLGDRYSRRWIMAAGVFLWCLTTFIGSFMTNYYWFLLFRTLVGVGEASYSTIAPTIISDLFISDMRSKMLALFYFAIPVGSGLGYIVGAETAKAAGLWQAGLRVTPALGIIAVVLIIFLMIDPVRGGAEGKTHLSASSWSQDCKVLVKNKSFMLSTAGFTCVAFVTGALAWWGPTFVRDGLRLQPGKENTTLDEVAFKFGATAMVSGLVGVPLGAILAQRLRSTMPRADPLICACGLLISAPLIFGALITARVDETACYILIFFGEVALNLNWSIVADILLYVVIPTRRSTAEAFQILISHAFGDAGSPYLIGLVSDKLKGILAVGGSAAALVATTTLAPSLGADIVGVSNSGADIVGVSAVLESGGEVTPSVEFHSFQYALFITCFVEVLGGLFFLLTALFIVHDRDEARQEVSGVDNPVVSTHLYADDPQLNRSEMNLTVA